MGEIDGAMPGLPMEAAVTGIPEDGAEVVELDQNAFEQQMYDAILKQRVMALGLTMAGARTRDGLYTAWAYNATATAGLLVEILRRQDTENSQELLDRLSDADATKEQNVGGRQVY